MFEGLFKYQENLYKEILKCIDNNRNRIAIYGNSGCGKTHLTEHLIQAILKTSENWLVLRFIGDEHCLEREFYPLISGLDTYCQKYNITKTIRKTVPKFLDDGSSKGFFFSYILDTILNRATENELYINSIFDDKEIDILYKIKSCISGKKCIFYLDNLHWWDEKSLQFFYMLLKYSHKYLRELDSSIILSNITLDQTDKFTQNLFSLINDFRFERFTFQKLSQDEYKQCLIDIGFRNVTDNVVKLLYKLTNQNIAITKNALLYPTSYSSLSIEIQIDEKDFLKILIEMRLTELGATGEQITEVLKYASLIGYAFSLHEIEYLVPFNDLEVKAIIDKANDLSLIEPKKMLYYFTHEVIRELFRKKLEEDRSLYWQKTITCLKALHPYDYETRISYLIKMGDLAELEKIYVLKIVSNLEKKGFCDENADLNILISEEVKYFIDRIRNAYIAYQSAKYTTAIRFLESIEDIFPIELLSIRDSLLSQCLTKKLSSKHRQQAVFVLQNYMYDFENFSEKQIWANTMMCLLAAYIHIRDINNAQAVLSKLYEFYAKYSKICLEFKKELNILRRKSTPFYELEVASVYLKKSVEFFGTRSNGFIMYPHQYFMSLINYSSNQICSGNFSNAFNCAQTAINLYNQMPGMRFPRLEIAINNFLVSGFLSEKISLYETIASISTLLDKLEDIADKTIIQTNLSVFYLLNFEKDKALLLLTSLNTTIEKSKCEEYSYIYHVKTNLLVIAILEQNWYSAESYVKELDDIIPRLYQNYFFKEKHSILSQFVEQHKEIQYNHSFTRIILESYQSFNPAWKFYGILPALNTLEYWSEP